MLQTPILFIVFNRIDTAQQVFNAIRQAQPCRLYLACDGPRTNNFKEKEACQKTRALSQQVDWPCQVYTNFLDQNEGPSKAPYHFIKWFFEHEEQGIILEHDCLPHPDFFSYCEILLNRYRTNEQIGTISGTNFVPCPNHTSYTFSIYNHIWGWATWKRTIDNYTLDFTHYSHPEFNQLTDEYFESNIEKAYWRTVFRQIKKGEIPTWDYYLTFCLWKHHLYSISPSVNLVSNIGFGAGAVNTTNPNSPAANMPTFPILPLSFNDIIIQNKDEEQRYFKKFILENKSIGRLYTKLFLKQIEIFKYITQFKSHFTSFFR